MTLLRYDSGKVYRFDVTTGTWVQTTRSVEAARKVSSMVSQTGITASSEETLSNKTISVDSNVINHSTTNELGDLLKSDGIHFVRLPSSSILGQSLQVIDAATGDIGWAAQPTAWNPNAIETLTNKTMDYNSNTFQNLPISSPLPSASGRYGTYHGISLTPVGEGLLTDLTLLSTTSTSITYIAAVGPAVTFTSGATTGNYGGFRTTNPITSRRFNPKVTCKFQINNNTTTRVKIGFSSSTSILDAGGNTFDNLSGAFIGFGSGNTTYFIYSNNGSATTTSTDTAISLVTAGNSVVVTLQINDVEGTITYSVQTAAGTTTSGTVSTGVPAQDTSLYVYCTGETNTTATRAFTVEWLDVQMSDTNKF